MNSSTIVILITLFSAHIVVCQWVSCPFNPSCECLPYEGFLLVNCMFFHNFPVFLNYSDQPVGAIVVAGSFPRVPNYAFYPLKTLRNAQITITNDKALRRSLVVEDKAFDIADTANIANVTISHWKLDGIPTGALVNHTFDLYFDSGDIETISDHSFESFQTSKIEIRECNVITVEPNAFSGVTFIGDPSKRKISLAVNNLVNISTAFRNLPINELVLIDNKISEIDDFAFTGNSMLELLELSFNPITFLSNNAFANLPQLAKLYLNHTNIATVPSNALSTIAANLQILDIGCNQISFIDVNSFIGLTSITDLLLDLNPIVSMTPGCFNGLNSLTNLNLNQLNNLSDVDVLITYGMKSLKKLQFNYCSQLETISVSDVTKLPPSLEMINISSNDIHEISSDLQEWLMISLTNTIDISNNTNYVCQSSIEWIAKFSLCQPIQIFTQMSYCGGTRQLLSDYLSTFNPTCD